MLIAGVRDFSIHGTKKTPSPLFEMPMVVAAIIPEGGCTIALQGED